MNRYNNENYHNYENDNENQIQNNNHNNQNQNSNQNNNQNHNQIMTKNNVWKNNEILDRNISEQSPSLGFDFIQNSIAIF